MDTALTPAVERIARVLAGERLSANAEGDQESASGAVDAVWQDYREQAIAVLHTLRAPSEKMAAAGDPAVWERMVLAAIEEAKPGVVM
ncbi:hypothetical protein [Sphingomonas sp.]|jgi:hypothetical protein|uniref:hypothetical protein n=1 Tax=Sphingomonas sp. TaxID=28214 RepID=UPI0035C853F0